MTQKENINNRKYLRTCTRKTFTCARNKGRQNSCWDQINTKLHPAFALSARVTFRESKARQRSRLRIALFFRRNTFKKKPTCNASRNNKIQNKKGAQGQNANTFRRRSSTTDIRLWIRIQLNVMFLSNVMVYCT